MNELHWRNNKKANQGTLRTQEVQFSYHLPFLSNMFGNKFLQYSQWPYQYICHFIEEATSSVFPWKKILSAQLMDVRRISLEEQASALSKPYYQPTCLFVALYTPLPPVTAQDNQNPCSESSDLAKTDTVQLIIHHNSETILDFKRQLYFCALYLR